MRELDFIAEIVADLAPHRPRIERRFNEENEAFKKLAAQGHDDIGHILKCHLIIENYTNRHLTSVSPDHAWDAARLTFSQKLALLPAANPKVAWILPGIREINKLRNRYGHDLHASLSLSDLGACRSVLALAMSGKEYREPREVLDDFTTLACTWLIVDEEIEHVFTAAFAKAREKHCI